MLLSLWTERRVNFLVWQSSLYLLALLIATVVAVAVAVAAWRHRPKPGAFPVAVLMFGVALWSLVYGVRAAFVVVAGKYPWDGVKNVRPFRSLEKPPTGFRTSASSWGLAGE